MQKPYPPLTYILSTPLPSMMLQYLQTYLLDRPINYVLRIVTGCRKSTPTEYLPVF